MPAARLSLCRKIAYNVTVLLLHQRGIRNEESEKENRSGEGPENSRPRGHSQRAIAAACGVCDDTLTGARKKDTPEIAEALRDGYEESNKVVENTLYQMAPQGECAAATIYCLKCRMPEKWNERRQLDVTSHGDPVVLQIIDDLKDDNGEDAGSGSDKSDA
jgi:hypothetical protein